MKAIPLCVLAALLAAAPVARADQMDTDLAEAKKLLMSGQDGEAQQKLDALKTRAGLAAAGNPQDAHAHYILGEAAMCLGDDKVAEAAIRAAVRLEPANITYALARAELANMQDDTAQAIALYQKAAAIDPKNVEAWTQMGLVQMQAEKFADAQASFQKAADLAPGQARYLVLMGEALVRQNKQDDALAAFDKALQLDATFVTALTDIGEIQQGRGKFEPALAAFQKAAALAPENFRILASQVQLFQAMGRTNERDAAREKIFALNKAGKVDAPGYCRERFSADKSSVMAFEYFELTPPQAVRYAFNFVSADGRTVEKRISLGSYDQTTQIARETGEIKPDERMFHLDVYTPTGHETLGMFKKEPTYEQTRALVQQYLDKKLAPLSSTRYPATSTAPGGSQ